LDAASRPAPRCAAFVADDRRITVRKWIVLPDSRRSDRKNTRERDRTPGWTGARSGSISPRAGSSPKEVTGSFACRSTPRSSNCGTSTPTVSWHRQKSPPRLEHAGRHESRAALAASWRPRRWRPSALVSAFIQGAARKSAATGPGHGAPGCSPPRGPKSRGRATVPDLGRPGGPKSRGRATVADLGRPGGPKSRGRATVPDLGPPGGPKSRMKPSWVDVPPFTKSRPDAQPQQVEGWSPGPLDSLLTKTRPRRPNTPGRAKATLLSLRLASPTCPMQPDAFACARTCTAAPRLAHNSG